MGQRLVISVKRHLGDEKLLCNIYYHWSGYTMASICCQGEIVNILKILKKEQQKELPDIEDKDILKAILKYLEKNGGGVNVCNGKEEHEYIEKKLGVVTKKSGYDRNNGLISCSPATMKMAQDFSEADIEIGINDELVSNYVNFTFSDYKEYVKNTFHSKKMREKDIPKVDWNMEEIKFSEVYKVFTDMKEIIEKSPIVKCNNNIYYESIT